MKKLLIFTVIAIAVAGPAHAGPVAAAVAWVGNAVSTAIAAGGFIGAVAQMAVGFGTSLLAGFIGKAAAEQPKVSVQFDVQFGDDSPLTLVVGDYATAGKRKYLGSWGKNNRYITDVIEVSCLPQPGLAAIWVNDEAGTVLTTTDTDGTGYNLGYPVTNLDDDGHRIWVRFVDGTQTAADPMLVALFADNEDYPWTADMVGAGKSYAIVTTRYDDDTLTSYPSYLFQPQPLPMYDPRKDSTVGGSGSHRWGNRSTYEPTRNPTIIAYNIIRGIYFGTEWVFGGKNLAAWRLPVADWMSAANECDDLVTLAAGGTEARYRCGLQISVDNSPADVLEEIGRAANMRFAEVGGRIKPVVDLPGASVFSFTDDDVLITEGQSFNPFNSLSDTYNAISASYPEPGEKWATKDSPEYIDTAATAEDGGRYLPVSVSYPAAPYRRQVQRLQRSQMRDYRRMRTHQFSLPPDAYALEPVDMVSWTSARNGYVNKRFTVETVTKAPGMNVLVSLREVDPSDYDWSSDFEMPTTVVTPVIVRPWVQPINGFGAQPISIKDDAGNDRRAGIRVFCNGDEVGVDRIRIQARVLGETENVIDTIRPFSAPFRWTLTNVTPLTRYQVRAQLLSEITPRSNWADWVGVLTLDIRVGSLDLDFEAIQDEVLEDLADLEDWAEGTGDYLREIMDEIAALRDAQANSDFGDLLARDQIRRDLAVEVEGARAAFSEQIDVVITTQLAAALRTTRLEASLRSTTASVSTEELARASADSALSARIDTVIASLGNYATATAVGALTSRVDTVEGTVQAQADAILTTNAQVGRMRASGLLRISSGSAPSGSQTRIAIAAEASDTDTTHTAGLYLEAKSDGTSHVIVAADRFAIATGTGAAAARRVPFVVNGGIVYIDTAFIRDATITGAHIANLTVDTINIRDGAITQVRSAANWTGVSTDNTSTWVTVQSLTWNSAKAGVHLQSVRLRRKAGSGGANYVYYRILLDGSVLELANDSTNGLPNPGTVVDGAVKEFTFIKNLAAGNHTMVIQMLTSGFAGTLGGEITDLEWYK